MHRERLALSSVVASLGELLRPIIGEHIEIVFDVGACAGALEADEGQIEQIVLALSREHADALRVIVTDVVTGRVSAGGSRTSAGPS